MLRNKLYKINNIKLLFAVVGGNFYFDDFIAYDWLIEIDCCALVAGLFIKMSFSTIEYPWDVFTKSIMG